VYRERSIIRGEYIGSEQKVYDFVDMIYGEGALSSSAVVDMGDYHIVCGRSNIYEYRGGFDLTPVADKLFYLMYSVDADINVALRYKLFAFFVEELNEVWIFYASTGNTQPNRVVRYEIGNERFTIREFANKFLGWGYFTRSTSLIWDDLVGDWVSQTWKWNSATLAIGAPTTTLCSPDSNQVYEYDYTAGDDDGVGIEWLAETKDFTDPPYNVRFDELLLSALGNGIEVRYSTDRGATWSMLGTINAGATLSRVRLNKQFVGNTIRLRFQGPAPAVVGQVSMLICRESEL
jgi:hypothetical protein